MQKQCYSLYLLSWVQSLDLFKIPRALVLLKNYLYTSLFIYVFIFYIVVYDLM
jgi:hypothetical protein